MGSTSVRLQLIGDCEYSGGTEPCDPFLPDPDVDYSDDKDDDKDRGNGISVILLKHFWIQAKAAKGTPAIDGCHSASGDLLSVPSTLVITAEEVVEAE